MDMLALFANIGISLLNILLYRDKNGSILVELFNCSQFALEKRNSWL